MVHTQDGDFDDLPDDTNSILHLQSVVTSVINGGVGHGQFGELASALDLHPICDLHLVVSKVPGADGRRPADNGQVHLQGLSRQDVDSPLGGAANVHHWQD